MIRRESAVVVVVVDVAAATVELGPRPFAVVLGAAVVLEDEVDEEDVVEDEEVVDDAGVVNVCCPPKTVMSTWLSPDPEE